MDNSKWFGREPALWLQTIGALLAVGVGFAIPGLNDAMAAAIMGVLTAAFGVWTAFSVRPVAPTLWTSLIIAGAGFASQLGFDLPQERVGLLVAGATAVMTLILRAQITPAHDPRT